MYMAERDREDEIEKGNSMAGGEEVGDYKMRGGETGKEAEALE